MNKMNPMYVAIVALVVALGTLALCLMCCSKNKSMSVEEALNNNPEMIINAMQKYEQNMRDQAQANAQKVIQDNLNEINNNPNSPVIGNPDGTITLVEFFDFSCGYCHKLYPSIKNIIAKNPEVKVVLKELAFLSPTSQYAAKAALAANEQGKYLEVYSALMENQGQLSEAKIDELAVKAGVDLEKMKSDMNSAKIEGIVKDTNELAGKVQINGVPTLVLNGKMLQTIDENVIQAEIDAIKSAQ